MESEPGIRGGAGRRRGRDGERKNTGRWGWGAPKVHLKRKERKNEGKKAGGKKRKTAPQREETEKIAVRAEAQGRDRDWDGKEEAGQRRREGGEACGQQGRDTKRKEAKRVGRCREKRCTLRDPDLRSDWGPEMA